MLHHLIQNGFIAQNSVPPNMLVSLAQILSIPIISIKKDSLKYKNTGIQSYMYVTQFQLYYSLSKNLYIKRMLHLFSWLLFSMFSFTISVGYISIENHGLLVSIQSSYNNIH